MKFLKVSFLVTFFIVSSCAKKTSEVVIKGNIKGIHNTPCTVFYTDPSTKASFFPFKEKVQLDSLGNFKIKFPLKKATFLTIVISKKNDFRQIGNVRLVVEPDKEYTVNFDLNNKNEANFFDIKSFDKKGQDLLNSLKKYGNIQIAAKRFLKDSIASNVILKIASLQNKEILKFEKLYKKDSISKSFFDLMELDRKYYYSALKGNVGYMKFLSTIRNGAIFPNDFKMMWATCFKNDLLSRSDFQNTEWGYDFVKNYLYYKSAKNNKFDIKQLQYSMKGKSNVDYMNQLIENILPEERIEFYKASFLFESLIQNRYEQELITIFKDYKSKFLNSNYSKYLSPLVSKVVGFHEIKKQSFKEEIKFVENFKDLDSFQKVLKTIKGKRFYIDFWASWCSPCKREFKHNTKLKELLKKHGYKQLYISIDRKENHQQWLDMIKFYNLEGLHVRANKYLAKEINKMGVSYIPRYYLVDENGNIIEKNAKKPSNLKALEKQLIEFHN
jgi:thiol-disulfide isomerase/thioredoxin